MRFLRALFLTVLAVLLVAGLLVVQVGAGLGLTILSPGFVLGAIDRVGIYQVVTDTAITALAPPTGAGAPQEAQLVVAAAREALTPAFLRQLVHEALPQLLRLVKDPAAPPEINVNLAGAREAFVAALVRIAKERHAPPAKIGEIRTEIAGQIPDTVDIIERMQLDPAPFRVAAGYYANAVRALLATVAVLAVLVLLCVAAGRRAWKAWVGVPFVLAGGAVAGLGFTARDVWLARLVEAARSGVDLPAGVDLDAVFRCLRGLGNEVLRVAVAVGAATALVGLFLVLLHALARRARRRTEHQPAQPAAG